MTQLSLIGYLVLLAAILMLPACAARQDAAVTNGGRALAEIRKVYFEGNDTFSSRALHQVIASTPRPFFPPWKRGESFNRPTLDADLQRLKKYYFDRGFLEAAARVKQVAEDLENNEVGITIEITEGRPTQIQAIRLVNIPEELPTQLNLLAELALQPKKRLTKAAFNTSKAQLIRLMQNAGYARAAVFPQTEVDRDRHQATVIFTLQPGKKTYFGEITISGEQQVTEQAIQRQLEIKTNDLYNPEKLTKSSDNIYRMEMFTAVTPQALNLDDDDEAPLHMAFDIRERKPHRLEFGVGVSNIKRFRFRVAWTHRNLFGHAESFTLSSKVDAFSQAAEAKFRLPYFLYRRTSFTQTLFIRNEQELNTDPLHLFDSVVKIRDDQPGYDLLKAGGISRVDHQLTDKISAAIGLDLSYNDFRNLSQARQVDTEDNLLFIQFALLRYDTSNDFLNPTRGFVLESRFEHSTSDLISDDSFVKLLFEGRHYLPIWWRMIFATRLVVGTIQPYGGTDSIPPNVRFFAGGTGSIRGFDLNRVGPLDAATDPEGGNSLIEGSVELRFPIVGDLWGALFVDYGNVYRQSFTFELDKLRYAVGPGIRYLTPIGPIRIDVGCLPKRQGDEDICKFEFSIGQAF